MLQYNKLQREFEVGLNVYHTDSCYGSPNLVSVIDCFFGGGLFYYSMSVTLNIVGHTMLLLWTNMAFQCEVFCINCLIVKMLCKYSIFNGTF